jgi:hypothetical protein
LIVFLFGQTQMTDLSNEREKEKLFEYIDKNIKLCTLEEKTHILTQIISSIGKSCIQVTADSSNIFLDDMPLTLLQEIKTYIEDGNIKNKIDFSDLNTLDYHTNDKPETKS